jgi:hypothetical protein
LPLHCYPKKNSHVANVEKKVSETKVIGPGSFENGIT